MARNDVVLVPFPFDDLSSTKVRPAVCLTDAIDRYRHVIVAFISSNVPASGLSSDIVIPDTSADFAQTGLRQSSCLRLHRLVTLTEASIIRRLGTIPAGVREDIAPALKQLFGLSDIAPP